MVTPLQETVLKHTTLHQGASSALESASSPDHIAEELRRYDEHLRDVRGLAAGTRQGLIRIAGLLLLIDFLKTL